MPFDLVFYTVSCIGFYKLGVFTQKHPGELTRYVKFVWRWMHQ